MVTSSYEWKILDWDKNPKQTKPLDLRGIESQIRNDIQEI